MKCAKDDEGKVLVHEKERNWIHGLVMQGEHINTPQICGTS